MGSVVPEWEVGHHLVLWTQLAGDYGISSLQKNQKLPWEGIFWGMIYVVEETHLQNPGRQPRRSPLALLCSCLRRFRQDRRLGKMIAKVIIREGRRKKGKGQGHPPG